jgi:uncharacterized membrane protein HdeD (DUF308 family)
MSLAPSRPDPEGPLTADDGHGHASPGDPLRRIASWCLWTGGGVAALGGLAIAAPWTASTVVAWVIGFTLLAAGVAQLGMAAGTYTWRGFWLALVCGALTVVAGTAMIAIPVPAVHVLVTFLGILILFEAAAKLTAAFSLPRDFPWGWVLVDGLVTALLGGILLTANAEQAPVYLGVIIGINLLSSGITLLASGIWLRRSVG